MISPVLRGLVILCAFMLFVPLSASADSGSSDNDLMTLTSKSPPNKSRLPIKTVINA